MAWASASAKGIPAARIVVLVRLRSDALRDAGQGAIVHITCLADRCASWSRSPAITRATNHVTYRESSRESEHGLSFERSRADEISCMRVEFGQPVGMSILWGETIDPKARLLDLLVQELNDACDLADRQRTNQRRRNSAGVHYGALMERGASVGLDGEVHHQPSWRVMAEV